MALPGHKVCESIRLDEKKTMVAKSARSISNSEEVIVEKLDEIDVPENGTFFSLT